MNVLQLIENSKKQGRKLFAVLIDPGKTGKLAELMEMCRKFPPDLFLVGGSQSSTPSVRRCIELIRSNSDKPVVIFPGDPSQIDRNADAVLLLSLISGRNPDLLIGQHVHAAERLKESKLEIIPTGYILIDKKNKSETAKVSGTEPMSVGNTEQICHTALAAEQLGMKLVYLEAGSGADHPVPVSLIKQVRDTITIPIICGGGLAEAAQLHERFEAGADIIVIGNHLEKKPADISLFQFKSTPHTK